MQTRIGIFGGTFDPVHLGHLIVAEVLRVRLDLDEVRFLPAGRPPHKPDQTLSADYDRIAMLRLAIKATPHFSISLMEIEREGPSFTADTVESLRRDLPEDGELYFLMGQDSMRDLPKWHQPSRIVRSARIGVARRPGVDVNIDDVETAIPEARGRVALVDVPLIGISSSDVREAVANRGPFWFQVLPEVADYIVEKGLYLHPGLTSPNG